MQQQHSGIPYGAYPCSMSREHLDGYLAQSGYGANAAIFNCYFCRDPATSAPLCVTCRRTIGEHGSAAVPVVATAVPTPTQSVTVVTVTEVPPIPYGLTVGDPHDIFEMDQTCGVGVGVGILTAFVIIEIIIFIGSGIYRNTVFVWIAPVVMTIAIIYLILKPRVCRIVFCKGLGPQSPVVVTRRRLFGCEADTHTTMAQLGQIAFRETITRRSITYTILAIAASGEETELYITHSYDYASTQYDAWRAYFSLYGVAAHPDLLPSAVAVIVSHQ